MERQEGEPTHARIFRIGKNGAIQPKFAGVTDESVFIPDQQIYISREEFDKLKSLTEKAPVIHSHGNIAD